MIDKEIKQLSQWFRLLGDPVRLKILSFLVVRSACVCELVELLPVSQSAVSQHLRKLRDAGIVQEHRDGKWVVYELHHDLPSDMRALIQKIPLPDNERTQIAEQPLASYCQIIDPQETESSSL